MKNRTLSAAIVAMATLAFVSCRDCSEKREVLPIMSWYSIPAEDATLERYQELADCGFNINFSHLYTLEDLQTSLELASRVGVKVMATCKELETSPDSVVALIKDHPALYGYFLRDEPAPPSFPELAQWARKIEYADGLVHPLYLNLLPNFVDTAVLGCNYREYVHRFIEEVKLPMVSFDYYPVTFGGISSDNWYDNMQVIHDESEAAGLPFWAFALSTAHDPYPLPTMASLRIEMYTALAYGAQGLQYFTYWNPGTEVWNFHEAPINQDKERSEAYWLVREMNKELQARAHVFVGSKVVSVNHVGKTMFRGCKPLEELPAHVTSLETGDGGAVVSLLEKDGWYYLVLVSRTLERPTDLKIAFDTKVSMIDTEGRAVRIPKGENSFCIGEGDVAIFRYRK